MRALWPWLALLALGAYHGINPGMGWLFAVALGLQEKSRRAVFAALPPIALGHALSIGVVAGIVWLAQLSLPAKALRIVIAALLFGFGAYRLFRARHPGWVGMRVGFRDLTLWSFLMASAHGAGLMLSPILLAMSAEHAAHNMEDGNHVHDVMDHAAHMAGIQTAADSSPLLPVAAVIAHTLAHLCVAALIAFVVYEKLGVAILRRGWFNLDLLWVIALMVAGVLVLVI